MSIVDGLIALMRVIGGLPISATPVPPSDSIDWIEHCHYS